MQAGRLLYPIKIHRRTSERDRFGGVRETYIPDPATYRAAIRRRSADEVIDGKEAFGAVCITLELHYHVTLDITDRVEHDKHLYNVVAVERDRMLRRTIVTAKLIND